jgi:hypothetical protein
MSTHKEKVDRIAAHLRNYAGEAPLSIKKRGVSHEVPKAGDRRRYDNKVDISDLNDILRIDPDRRVCEAEPGVTFEELVRATTPYGLTPIIVPEFRTITIGGAVAGCSIESMSFKEGGFHDTCLAYEVVTAKGEVLHCTPENENSLIFQMVHGTFGTLGIITKLTFRLIPAQPYVHMSYELYHSLAEYKEAIWSHFTRQDVDFMDGIIHGPREYALSLGNFTDRAPYTNSYQWLKVYYKTTKKRSEDYLELEDYYFRYDQGVTGVGPESLPGRLLFGKLLSSTRKLRLAESLQRLVPFDFVPITVDLFIPYRKIEEFMEWYIREVNYFPLWCVPYRNVRDYEWIDDAFLERFRDQLFLDLAIYGMQRQKDRNIYRVLEEGLMEVGGIKTLISSNYYSEQEFWSIWNRRNYEKVKAITDPQNYLRDLYQKTCRTMRGEE